MNNKQPKIAVAMSGGIDSSVSARILKNKNFDISGFYMDLGCGSPKNAEKAAVKLKVPFFKVSAKNIFRRSVIEYFIEEYKNLRTPNPCVVCNKNIKFGWLMEIVQKNKFDKLATGHYARIKKDKNGVFHLLAGKDKNKDQSYFLYRLNQKQLSRVIFPLGNMTKEETRLMAKKIKLPIDVSGESQEICFLEGMNYREFLKKRLSQKYFGPGNIVNSEGKIVGQHNGLINYTVGQRRGIEQSDIVSNNKNKLYVTGFNQKKNELIVGENRDLLEKEIVVGNLSWISDWARKKAFQNKNIKARIRYRHVPASCSIESMNSKKIKIVFKSGQRAIVPGQSLAVCSGQEVLGGGIII